MSSRVTLAQIVDNITQLSAAVKPAEFIYDFLTCFGLPKATIARLKGVGGVNLAKKEGCTLLKTKVYFEPLRADLVKAATPMRAIEAAQKDSRIAANKPRFLIATDFRTLAAFDTKRRDTVEFPIGDLHEHYTFFLPLAGMEKSTVHAEAEADVKAAENMAKLYDLIRADKPKPKRTPQTSEEERLLEGFQELVRFVETTGVAPVERGAGMNERLLFTRLNAIRKNPAQRERLLPFDEYGLLKGEIAVPVKEKPQPATIDDILNDTFLDSLEEGAPDIFTIKHVPPAKDFEAPDYVAQRKPCKDFHVFEEQFQDCQKELKAEKRRLLPFANEQQIEVGKFYVLRGILLLVTVVGERAEKNGKWNARLRCIFENGTESDMLLRSLASELYKDGRRVTELDEKALNAMLVTDDDKASGFIYVLRSLSEHPDIKAVPNLYKIGLARRSIEGRIQNAANEPTYLMAPVALVSTFQCYNVNLPKLENLLHRFFDHATAKVQVSDAQGNYHTPKEWFSVPIETIETAVRLLISGEIVNYRYDATTGQVLVNS